MAFTDNKQKLKGDEIKFYIFMAISGIILLPDKWYRHLENRDLVRASVMLMLFGILHWRFNDVVTLKYRESQERAPKLLRIFALTPNSEVLKLLGIICFGLGAILLVVWSL
jgi:hypothetical protein